MFLFNQPEQPVLRPGHGDIRMQLSVGPEVGLDCRLIIRSFRDY